MNRTTRGVVWSDPTTDMAAPMENIKENDVDFKIANDLSDKIANLIGTSYADKPIIAKLINAAIQEQIRQYLREYDNVVAEDVLNGLKGWILSEIKGWTSEVDFSNARHAKLYSFGEELKKEFDLLRDNNCLLKVRERIEKLNTEPLKTADNGDGVIWKSNVLTIIDEEMGVGKEEPETTDNIG